MSKFARAAELAFWVASAAALFYVLYVAFLMFSAVQFANIIFGLVFHSENSDFGQALPGNPLLILLSLIMCSLLMLYSGSRVVRLLLTSQSKNGVK